MTIKVGDRLPAGTLQEYYDVEKDGCSIGPNPVSIESLTKGKKVVLFSVPFCREFFALDPSNVAYSTIAFTCGAIGVLLVEACWWVTGRIHGERRRLFASREDLPGAP